MNEKMIEYFGYKGDARDQKKAINNLINENFLEYKNELYFEYDNKTYIKFRKETEESLTGEYYPVKKIDELYPLKTGKNMSKVKHILIAPKLFKEMLMLCNTEKGKQVRRYYLDIVDVMELYVQFQNKLTITTLEQKLDNMALKLDDNDKKAEARFQEERKKADEERKKADNRFNRLLGVAEDTKEEVLEKISELAETRLDLTNVVNDRVSTKRVPNNTREYLVILRNVDDAAMPYYVLRTQRKSVSKRIAELSQEYNIEEVFRIYEPNAKICWRSICDKFASNIRKSKKQNWFALRNITEAEFKRQVIDMDKSERQNPKYI
jgi:hypothetical protein